MYLLKYYYIYIYIYKKYIITIYDLGKFKQLIISILYVLKYNKLKWIYNILRYKQLF